MASINCNINRDASGKTKVTYTINHFDPNDEIVMRSDTANTAVQWKGDSADPAKNLYRASSGGANPQSVVVTKAMTLSPPLCGEVDANGNFTAWEDGGFPEVGNKSAPVTR